MGDVDEPEVGDLEFYDEDIAVKYHELEAKFQAFQETSVKETESLRIQVEKAKVENEKAKELAEVKVHLEE